MSRRISLDPKMRPIIFENWPPMLGAGVCVYFWVNKERGEGWVAW